MYHLPQVLLSPAKIAQPPPEAMWESTHMVPQFSARTSQGVTTETSKVERDMKDLMVFSGLRRRVRAFELRIHL